MTWKIEIYCGEKINGQLRLHYGSSHDVYKFLETAILFNPFFAFLLFAFEHHDISLAVRNILDIFVTEEEMINSSCWIGNDNLLPEDMNDFEKSLCGYHGKKHDKK